MSSPRPITTRRPRPVFEGPTYTSPQYHSSTWGRLIFLGFILLLCLVFGVGGGLYWSLHRAQASSSRTVTVRVGTGDTVNSIADSLASRGVINNALLFRLDARIRNLGGKLKVGDYQLRRNMSIDDMVGALSVYHADNVSFTVPEGFRLEQIAAIMNRNGLDGAGFLREARHPDVRFLGASVLADKPAGASLEGYLFPDTYTEDRRAHLSGQEIARQMVRNLDSKFSAAMRAAVKAQGRTIYQALILASIVEREAAIPTDRPKIASVYVNRLRLGMELGADPTIQYATGTARDWWPQLHTEARAIVPNSPYNTYTHKGLPPGPIANPGLASINAAVHPASTDFLFFLAIPHSHGRTVFARTYEEQLANQQKYGYD